MSWSPAPRPVCLRDEDTPWIETVIEPRTRDLGGVPVRRVLPSSARRLVGPFIFFDHMGAADLEPGRGIDVRPHPHIHLETVTYLFEGEILHRDSLGSHQPIRPGAINWMTAGRGIVHSERSGPDERARGSRLHGLQLWVALPRAHEDTEPAFWHHPADSLPEIDRDGARLRVLAGTAFGTSAPVRVVAPLFLVDAALEPGAEIPLPAEEERAVYVVSGAVHLGATRLDAHHMAVVAPGDGGTLRADSPARAILLGGAPLDGERHIWWNFVSSSRDRIERAKQDWRDGRFPKVPGDEHEFIPLPGDGSSPRS